MTFETARWAVLASLVAAIGSCAATAVAIGFLAGEAVLTDPRTLWVVIALVPALALVVTFRAIVRKPKGPDARIR